MKKQNEDLIYEIVRRELETVGSNGSEYILAVSTNNCLMITRRYLGHSISKEYHGKDILELMNKYPDKTLFSAILEELSFSNNMDEIRRQRKMKYEVDSLPDQI